LVIAGAEDVVETWDEDEVRRALAREREAGATAKEAVQTVVALSGWSRRDVYRLWVELDKSE
jgi:hypothetical protein